MVEWVVVKSKKCSKCKRTKRADLFNKCNKNKTHGLQSQCRSCSKKANKENHYRQILDPSYRARKLVQGAKHRCKRDGIPFNLDPDDILPFLEIGMCPYTNMPFDLRAPGKKRHIGQFTPSMHRIDPDAGYVKGNVILISWQANRSIGEWGEAAFEDFAFEYLKFKRPDLIVAKPKRRRADNDNAVQLDMFAMAA